MGKLIVLTGVNGSGKDTVASKVIEKLGTQDSSTIISESRMLMYINGITDSPDSRLQVDKDKYVQLESISPESNAMLMKKKFPALIKRIINSNDYTFYLTHLVFQRYLLDGEADFLYAPIRHLIDHADVWINLDVDSEDILQRRMTDKSRVRNVTNVKEIEHHQNLCRSRLKAQILTSRIADETKVVSNNNGQLDDAVDEIFNFIKDINL